MIQTLDSPIATLASRHLQHKSIALWPRLHVAEVERTSAASGAGLDHTIGEHALAFGNASDKERLEAFFLLTNRRLAGRQHIAAVSGVRKSRFDARLTDVAQVKWTSSFWRSELNLQVADKWIDATIVKFTPQLGKFFDDLVRIPPEYRAPAPQPLLMQSADDATGVNAAMSRVSHPRCSSLLNIIRAQHQRGFFAQQPAADLTARVVLLDRTSTLGRGMSEGWWLSPLAVTDLTQAFFRVLGEPSASWPQSSLLTFDFDLKANRGVGKAVASSAIGLAALGLLGVGWISTPGGPPLTHLRVSLCSTPFSSGFTILGVTSQSGMQPLSDNAPKVLEKIFNLLSQIESEFLLGRCLYGWDEPMDQLAARSEDEINQKLRDFEPV
jgi:hypothetical protein